MSGCRRRKAKYAAASSDKEAWIKPTSHPPEDDNELTRAIRSKFCGKSNSDLEIKNLKNFESKTRIIY
ncbi:hypothetical protein ACOSP7_018418 [Xanthoceras sorbifolium]